MSDVTATAPARTPKYFPVSAAPTPPSAGAHQKLMERGYQPVVEEVLVQGSSDDVLSDMVVSASASAGALEGEIDKLGGLTELERLIAGARLYERSRAALEQTMVRAEAHNPEEVGLLRGELKRARTEIAAQQREIAALRRTGQRAGAVAGAGYWRNMGGRMERDADDLLDALEDAREGCVTRLMEMAQRMAETLKEFGGHCHAYADVV